MLEDIQCVLWFGALLVQFVLMENNMKMLIGLLRFKCLNLFRDFFKLYVRSKYDVTGDVCFVYSRDGKTLFYMTDTINGQCAVSDKACELIRKQCGENKLMEYGLPQPEQLIPRLVLVPTLSMLQVLGVKKFIKFLQDWPGDSKVGDITVMKYSVMQ